MRDIESQSSTIMAILMILAILTIGFFLVKE
jgi:hypothetical protein